MLVYYFVVTMLLANTSEEKSYIFVVKMHFSCWSCVWFFPAAEAPGVHMSC